MLSGGREVKKPRVDDRKQDFNVWAEVPEPQEAPDPQRRGQAHPRQLRGARPLHSVSVFACDPRE